VKGRKRSLVVDTLGLILAVSVAAANFQDRDAATEAVARAAPKYPTVETLNQVPQTEPTKDDKQTGEQNQPPFGNGWYAAGG
jgi:hypothetical protein